MPSGQTTANEPELGARWAEYDTWNSALVKTVYVADAAGSAVFLDLEDEVLERAARRCSVASEDAAASLVSAVRATLDPPSDRGGAFRSHLARLRRWKRAGGRDAPPVVALLGVLCLAAEQMRAGGGFAANNYYDRLMPLLDVTDDDDKRRVIRAYRNCSQELWESLNGWLEDLDGGRGLPTAYSYTHRYIGRPLSQALIRATDREKLSTFFGESGFSPHARVSPLDMEPLLAEWVGRTPPVASHGLRLLWRRPAARERITEVACHLLEGWEPPEDVMSSEPGSFTSTGTIRLMVLLRTHLRPSLEMGLTGSGGSAGELHVEGASNAVFLATEPIPGGRWRLADPGQIDRSSVMSGHLVLVDRSGLRFERRPRRVVPLVRDHMTQSFVEVERLPLGEDSILVCHHSAVDPVRRALASIARRGFREWDESLAGLPEGWVVFSDVQLLTGLVGSDESTGRPWIDDLNVLQPLATSQFVLDGGLQLPGRIRRWSTLAPPELRVTTDGEDPIHVSIEQVRALAQPVGRMEWFAEGPAVIVNLADADLGDGDYEIEVSEEVAGRRRRMHQARLRLRSAEVPNPLPPPSPVLSHHLPSNPVGVLTASREPGVGVYGPNSHAPIELRSDLLGAEPDPLPFWWNRRHSGDVPSRPTEQRVHVEAVDLIDCFHTGEHVIVLPPWYGELTRGSLVGECRHCGLVKRYPPQGRRRQRAATAELPRFDFSGVPEVERASITADEVFDALTHDGAGSAAGIRQLAYQLEPSEMTFDRLLRQLDVESHIELNRDAETLRVMEWEMVPATLVGTCAGTYVLVGSRNRSLISSIEHHAIRLGIATRVHAREQMVSQTVIGPCPESALTDLWVGVVEDGHSLDVATEAARRLVNLLPPLIDVVGGLAPQAVPGFSHAERWDDHSARWDNVGDASQPGAYRLSGPHAVYGLRTREDVARGTYRRGDARLVKHASALESGSCLLGYHANERTLYVPLGADLPGLYGRAAALCSGSAPREDPEQHILAYTDVPSDVASALRTLLMS